MLKMNKVLKIKENKNKSKKNNSTKVIKQKILQK